MLGVILKQVSGCINLTLGTGFDIWYLFTLDINCLKLTKSKETFMTPYYYKIQRTLDSISGEVLSQEVLDTVQSPVE